MKACNVTAVHILQHCNCDTCVLISGHVEVMNFMLSKCTVEVDARNALGFTPLMKAALQGRTKCAKILLLAGKRMALCSAPANHRRFCHLSALPHSLPVVVFRPQRRKNP